MSWARVAAILVCVLGAIVVINGDTVRMDGKKYRLLGFDTPETVFAMCPEERVLGDAAAARLLELLAIKTAELVPTGKSCKWRRGCAHLFLDGEDVAAIMIREGLVVPYNGRGKRQSWCE